MKIHLLSLFVSIVTVHAGASLPMTACYLESDKKIGQYQTQITVTSGYVSVVYYSPKVSDLGGYTGTIYGTPEVKNGVLKLEKLTLNDGYDGWLDKMKLEITPTTVLFAEMDSKDKPQPRVACWPRQ